MSRGMAAPGLVQYVVVRGDLLAARGWSLGALVAQACHACTAALHVHRDHPDTQAYLADLDNMHKVVLEAKSEDELVALAETLTNNSIAHKLWIEQPEDIPTCLALRPYTKEAVKQFVSKFKLYRSTVIV